MAGTILVQAMGENLEEVKAKLREVVGQGPDGEAPDITLSQAVEYVWEQMGGPKDFQIHAAMRELTFQTNQGGIPQTQRVKF